MDEVFVFKVIDVTVIDADTVFCTVDLGFGIYTEKTVRLAGVDAPETKTKKTLEKQAARVAKYAVFNWVNTALNEGRFALDLISYEARDKFGRVVGDLKKGEESLCRVLLRHKLVKTYKGKKSVWGRDELLHIIGFDASVFKGKPE